MVASICSDLTIRLAAIGKTDVGLMRTNNEDRFLVCHELDLFAVADGMGGTQAGEVASDLAVRTLEEVFRGERALTLHEVPSSCNVVVPAAERLAQAIAQANADVFEASCLREEHRGMGSTIVAAHFSQETMQMHIAHVGDSRCYLLRDGDLVQLTRDHSLVNETRALAPYLEAAELARVPRNVISRALGLRHGVEVDVRSESVLAQDLFLLCSDGLSGALSDRQIADALKATADLDQASELLVTLANEEGGADNITVVLVRLGLGAPGSELLDPDADPESLDHLMVGVHPAEPFAPRRSTFRRILAHAPVCRRCGATLRGAGVRCDACGYP